MLSSSAGGLALVHRLSCGSIVPLLATYFEHGPLSVHYLQATRGGLRATSWLARLGVLRGEPVPIDDLLVADTPQNRYWQTELEVASLCRGHEAIVASLVGRCLKHSDPQYQAIATASVLKQWAAVIAVLEHLRTGVAAWASHHDGLPIERTVVISPHATLRRMLGPIAESPRLRSQVSPRPWFVVSAAALIAATFRVVVAPFRKGHEGHRQTHLAVTGVWGLDRDRGNDLFWWWNSGIPSSRMVYLFDAPDFPATPEVVRETRGLGVRPAVLHRRAVRARSLLVTPGIASWSRLLPEAKRVADMVRRAVLAEPLTRSTLAALSWHQVAASRLASQYRELGVRAVAHHQEADADYVALGAEAADAIRVGFAWSSKDGPSAPGLRTHHVFFCWGPHDAGICLESGAISPHLLIAGCPIHEMRSSERSRLQARDAATEVRRHGAALLLAVFDSSNASPNFYRFLLDWLLEVPTLGLLVKSKATAWTRAERDGLDGRVSRALATGRLQTLESEASPADAALACDFAVGMTSLSALIVSALAGSRVLYLDYAHVDRGPLKPFAAFHSLGPERCAFTDPSALRSAVSRYLDHPASNPQLGDASPLLDLFDPFRDGRAGDRIGEYLRWYVEALDSGLGREAALERATRSYADKWGANRVVRGLRR